MKTVILTLILAFVIIAGSFVIYISSGSYDISQLSKHNALTKWMIHTTTEHSIGKRIKDIQVPPMNDSDAIVIGFLHYNEMCVMCHGAPGIKPEEMAEGLYPKPPELSKPGKGDAAGTFWVIKNGIKMTAMPGYGPTHDDKKIWAITDFVLNKLPKMSPDEYKAWKQKYADGEDDDAESLSEKDKD